MLPLGGSSSKALKLLFTFTSLHRWQRVVIWQNNVWKSTHLKSWGGGLPVRGEVVIGSHSVVSEQSLCAVFPSLCKTQYMSVQWLPLLCTEGQCLPKWINASCVPPCWVLYMNAYVIYDEVRTRALLFTIRFNWTTQMLVWASLAAATSYCLQSNNGNTSAVWDVLYMWEEEEHITMAKGRRSNSVEVIGILKSTLACQPDCMWLIDCQLRTTWSGDDWINWHCTTEKKPNWIFSLVLIFPSFDPKASNLRSSAFTCPHVLFICLW